jgi:Na+-transporting methylmalonyl-CoA/oxaloacetate decarboxylase gamma subunit
LTISLLAAAVISAVSAAIASTAASTASTATAAAAAAQNDNEQDNPNTTVITAATGIVAHVDFLLSVTVHNIALEQMVLQVFFCFPVRIFP